MLQARILWVAWAACCLVGSHASFGTENPIGEMMLSTGKSALNGVIDLFRDPSYDLTVDFFLYTKNNPTESQKLFVKETKRLEETNFNITKKTLVVIHGFRSNSESPIELTIKKSALEFHDVNVIDVDWKYYAMSPDYGYSMAHVRGVGDYLGQLLERLISQGVNEKDLHLIGHSLGAHIAGFAGKKLKADNLTVARITGLDPAFPGYYFADSSARIDAGDADFVDCIHTCGGKLGFPNPICQADYFPNGGLDVQPGCTLFDFGTCSHKRSYKYFVESIDPTHNFNARSCQGLDFWIPYNCYDKGALMGYPATSHLLLLRANRPGDAHWNGTLNSSIRKRGLRGWAHKLLKKDWYFVPRADKSRKVGL